MLKKSSQAKARYNKKIFDAAGVIGCACGCPGTFKAVNVYGRPRRYLPGHNNRMYEIPGQHKREWNHRNRNSRYDLKKNRWRRLKVKLVLQFGSKCQRACGAAYDGTNAAIFHFHHRDPSIKSFALGNQLVNKAWKTIQAEAEKCDMICANCHELSHGERF